MPHLSIENSDTSNRLNDYISACNKSGYPSVVCKRYTKYAEVAVMFDIADSFSLAPYEERAKDIIESVSHIIRKHTEVHPGDTIQLFTVYVRKREIPTAEALASDLSEYYTELVDNLKASS